MARKNKKRKGNGVAFPAPFAVVLVMSCVLSLLYLFLGARCIAVGEEIKILEKQHEELNKIRMNEEYKWSQMRSPRYMMASLDRFGLKMTWPTRSQIVYMEMAPGLERDRMVTMTEPDAVIRVVGANE